MSDNSGSHIPVVDLGPSHEEVRDDLDRAYADVVASGAFIGGSALDKFERRWADRCLRSHAVGVGSGTDALELAFRAKGIGPGDEVIVPSMTFVATAAAVAATGATPVYVDVRPDNLLVDLDQVTAAHTARTVGVAPVHLYGNPVRLESLMAWARRHGVFVVEDCAQAHGALVDDRPVGSLGDAGAFSFYPSKNLGALGDGGALVTDDGDLADRVRRIGSHGRDPSGAFGYLELGRTSRLDNLQAAFLDVKLDHLDRWNEARRTILGWYRDLLPDDLQPMAPDPGTTPAPHLCVVQVEDRDAVRSALARRGIGTGIHYHLACHQTEAVGNVDVHLPVAERAAASVLSLPLFPQLGRSDVERVCRELRDVCRAGR
jgi:dTDP-4-amino-4,6-dideoxygalactose transaminase